MTFFENVPLIQPLYCRVKKLRNFIILLNIFSFGFSLITFDHRKKYYLIHDDGHIHNKHYKNLFGLEGLEIILIAQTFINLFILFLDYKHILYEREIHNLKNPYTRR